MATGHVAGTFTMRAKLDDKEGEEVLEDETTTVPRDMDGFILERPLSPSTHARLITSVSC